MTKTESQGKSATMGDQMSGMWGGDHISLEVNDSGATVEYDCAHGTITEKLVPDSSGKLVVKGFYVREHPGPIREGEEARGEPAVYSASLNGETMTLTVTLSRTKETVGPFTLTHGKMGRLRKCG